MDIAICSSCGAKNRLKPSPKGQLPVCGKCGSQLPWLVKADDATFLAEVDASIPVLVDFWAEWCGPCRMIAPVLEELSKDLAGKLKIVKLNVDENPRTSQQYQVRSIPMLMVFKNAQAVDTFVGAMPKAALLQRLAAHLVMSTAMMLLIFFWLPLAGAQQSLTLATAGDIACAPGRTVRDSQCQHEATARLIESMQPSAVLLLGDIQYEKGLLEDFEAVFDRTWGQFKDLMYPSPGNHEYYSGGQGYFDYFGARAGDSNKGYYSFTLGDWHLISLNSSCEEAGGCGAGSPQAEWLRADLAANSSLCALAFWHYPLFSSGRHGNHDFMEDLFEILDEAGVDLALAAHDHHYERFAPQTAKAEADARGVRQFVVGTGGRSLYPLKEAQPNSELRNNETFGVLRLELNPTGYRWAFVPIEGSSFSDSGEDTCR